VRTTIEDAIMTQRISFTILVLLAMFCAVIGPATDQEATARLGFHSASAIAQTAISSQSQTIVLPGTVHSLNTNIAVVSGDIIQITATGLIRNSPGDVDITSDGLNYCHCVVGVSLLPNVAASSLIGSIGNSFTGINLLDDGRDINPQGMTGTSIGRPGLFGPGYIGSSFIGSAASSGEIYIAYNDTFPDDNVGSFTVTITVTPKQSLQYKSYLASIYQ
jgi:hypothetical protein